MKKPNRERELLAEIRLLETRAAERKTYCMNNIDAANYDEVSRDYRAVMVKIEAKKQQLRQLNSSIDIMEQHIRITPGIKCVL
jgi:hypothetical protein